MTHQPVDPAARDAFMALAIEQAQKGIGRTQRNPSVGAVVVRSGQIVSSGFTQPAGRPHAEEEALGTAGDAARGADLYVTLEPCNHFGRGPPCTDAILRAGIARVFIGAIDPNPRVFGRGIQRLRDAGVDVETRILEAQCDALIRPFRKYITTGRPFVVLKAAATLDGKLATRTGDSKWISGDLSRRRVHVWRDEFDAVLVGAGTLRADDPQLTVRLDFPAVAGRTPRNPVRIVLAGDRAAPPSAQLWDVSVAPTIIACSPEQAPKWEVAHHRGVDLLVVPSIDGRVELSALMDALGERGITSVLVEGGAAVHASFLKAGLVDEVRLFLAPRIAGGDGLSWMGPLGINEMRSAWRLGQVSVEKIETDLLITGQPLPSEG